VVPEDDQKVVQGDLITHRGKLTDQTTDAFVGYIHSTCLVMYQGTDDEEEPAGLNVGTGVVELEIDGKNTQLMFQGLFPTAEPHGNFELGIQASTGAIKNAQGWIEMNMEGGGEGEGHPAIFHICPGVTEK
jgi:hypothetical protein